MSKKIRFSFSKFNRTRRLLAFFALCFLIVGIPLGIYLARTPQSTEAGWWDETWMYRRRIPITYAGSENLTEYQVLIDGLDTATLVTNGHLQSDCDDLRFTNISGALLPYSIVGATCNTSDTEIWVKIDQIFATTDIFLYYGNKIAAAGMDESATFSYSTEKNVAYVMSNNFGAALNIISLDNGNTISHDGNTASLNYKQTDTSTLVDDQYQPISAKKLFNVSGGNSNVNFVNPVSWAGWEFTYTALSGSAKQIFILSPWGNADVTLYDDGATETSCTNASTAPFTVGTSGVSVECTNAQMADDSVIRISAANGANDPPILVYVHENDSAFQAPLHPATTEYLYGYASQNARVSAINATADYRYIFDTDASETNPADLGANLYIAVATGESNFNTLSGPIRFYSTSGKIGVTQQNDGAGSARTSFVNRRDFGTIFGSSNPTSWIAVASDQATTCTSYNASNAAVDTVNIGAASPANTAVFGLRTAGDFGTGSTTQYLAGGWTIICAKPVYAWWQIYDTAPDYDEQNLMSYPMMRQYTYPPPEVGTLQSQEITPGPVLFWKFDEGADNTCSGGTNDVCDSTSNQNDAPSTATRAASNNCFMGLCLQFNTNVVTLATANDALVDFSGSEAFSAGAWIYTTSMPTSTGSDKDAIIVKWDDNSNQAAYRLYVENDDTDNTGNVEVQLYDESASQAITATGTTDAIAENTWYHVEFSFNGGTSGAAGDLKLYVNGLYQAQNAQNASFLGLENLASDFTVGDYDTNDSTSGNTAFVGYIDEVKVFAYARSADQIKTDYIKGSSATGSNIAIGIGGTPMPTPELWWRFDEGSGTTANNSGGSGSTYNGAITSGTWTSSGKFDKALTLTAASSVSDTITDPGSTHSISLWVYPTTSIASKNLVTAGKLVTNASSQPTYGTCTGTALSLSSWQHLAVVSNGAGSCKIYQNGVETSSNTTGVSFGTTFNVGGSSFIGSVDEVKMYTSALSADQIKNDYNARSSVNVASGTNERATLTDGDYSANLVGFWPLDENTDNSCSGGTNDACDRSGSGNDAAITAGTGGWTPGKIGSGYSFDNANTMINAGSGTTLDNLPTSGMTVSAWIYPTSQGEGSAGMIIAKNSGATPSSGWILKFAGTNALTFSVDGSTDLVRTTSNSAITLNAWNHVLVSWDGVITTAATADIYINGYEASYATTTNGANRVDDGTSSLYIGNSSGQTSTFQGVIDQVRVFNNDLTPSQIAYEYNRGNPIAWFRMDECQGSTLHDSIHGYSATIFPVSAGNTTVGTCFTGVSTHMWADGATGKINASLGLDGSDDYVTISDTTYPYFRFDSATQDFSVFAWIKRGSTGTEQHIIAKEDGNDDGWLVRFGSGNKFNCDLNSVNSQSTNTLSDTSSWHHIGCVYDRNGYATVYIDGVGNNGSSGLASAAMATTADLSIGKSSYASSSYFNGLIDDVKIFNYALSPEQVKIHYTGGSASF